MVAAGRIPRRAVLHGAVFGLGSALGVGAVVSSLAARPAFGQDAPVAHVHAWLGRVGLTGSDGRTRTAQTNMAVAAGDHVVTGEAGRVTLRFDGGMVVTAGAATNLEVIANAATLSGWRGVARLYRGVVRLETAPGAQVDGFVVTTPTAQVSTRGAHALVDASPTLTSVYAERGRVLVSGPAGPAESVTVLGGGYGVDSLRHQPVYDPLRWAPARAEALLARTLYP